MSGIFGYAAGSGDPRAVVRLMGEQLRHQEHHRVECAAIGETVALGRHTIGIFNLSPQPVVSRDGRIALVFCGELYHQEARRAELRNAGEQPPDGDAELALRVYAREGAAGLTRLEGAFAVAVWDAAAGELTLVNDRFGLYPHYYAHSGGAFAFAPEIKGVLCAPQVSRRLNETALAEFVRFQQLLGDKTWFTDVAILPPASLLRYRPDDDCLTLSRYWDWDRIEPGPRIGFDDAVEEASRLFSRAIDAMITPRRRVGIYLSGGMDGRMIAAFAAGKLPLTTISFGHRACRDVVYSAELARRLGSQHHWFGLNGGRWVLEHTDLHLALTEGMHSWMHAHGISTHAEARKLIDVNLSGWDGEATLGGLAVENDPIADRFYRFPPDEATLVQRMYQAFCTKLTWPGLTEAEAAMLLDTRHGRGLRGLAFESLRREIGRTAHYPADRRVNYIVNDQLLRRSLQSQVVFARSSIEVRCPYFDYDLVTFMYGLPDRIRSDPRFRRAMLTRRMPRLATVPYDKDNRLPHSNRFVRGSHALGQRAKGVIHRRLLPIFPERTQLYADYEAYLRSDLRAWAEGILFDREARTRELFDAATVRALWNRHLSGEELWTIGKIAPLMNIERVLRHFDAALDA